MLTQGPAADPKCKLIISAFLALPHLLDCLTCTRNDMSIVLLLQMMGRWDRRRWLIYIRVLEGARVGINLIQGGFKHFISKIQPLSLLFILFPTLSAPPKCYFPALFGKYILFSSQEM